MDNGSLEAKERKTIVDVLVAVTKEKPRPSAGTSTAKPEVSELPKYIGDNIVKALHAVMKAKPPPHSTSPLAHAGTDWQKVQLVEVWWEGVDARGIDFFQANFERAGLAGAHLHKTVFYQTSLRGAVLRNADLREANLEEADLSGVNLNGADLTGAKLRDAKLEGIKYDAKTKWPTGFQPPDARPTA